MTVSSSTNRVSYSGNGTLTVFAYTFKVFDESDLTVILRASDGTETVQTITTHYTVSGVGDVGGGNITFVTAPTATQTVVILREQPLTQGLDLVPNDPFPAESLEESFDKLTFMVQQHEEELGRAIKASRTNTITTTEFVESASDRANKVIAFDGSGDLDLTQEIGTFRGNWAASTAYAVRDIVKDTNNNNIYIANTAHTSSGTVPLTGNADIAKWDLLVDAAAATTSANNAATSATAAATSATAAATSATAAATSESNAATSASNASTSETNAAASATNAATSESNAAGSESAAATSESNAATSATNASTSASAAATSATNAATSETAAAASQAAAATSETNAATSATSAATNATNAATSASNASTSETNAATSETNAATSATAAAASQTAAAASAASAASAYDSFDDRYLGVKASDPTVDNDGDPLSSGLLYFSSSENIMKVYDGASWIAATSAGNVSLTTYQYTATGGQTTFSGSDDNAATLTYTVNNILVTLNGSLLFNGTDYTATNGTSIVLSSGATASDVLQVTAFASFTTADMVPASTGGTFSGNVAVTGDLTVDTNTLYVDSTNNRVGVGTTSPTAPLEVIGGQLRVAASTASSMFLASPSTTYSDGIELHSTYNGGGSFGPMKFYTSSTERMRIDASGNLLVGKTSATTFGTEGIELRANDIIWATRTSAPSLELNRLTTDGDIAVFYKDGTIVGSITTGAGGYMHIKGGNNTFGSGIAFNNQTWNPTNASGTVTDNHVKLGDTGSRFTDLYLSGGVYLGGTGSANLLDDYEEGTWTPSLNAGGTFSTVGATYTKIGRLVTITLDGTVGTGGGDQITNLPFTTGVTTATALYTSGQNFNSGRTVPIAIVGGGQTALYFRDIGDNVAFAAMPLTAGAGITFNITYYVN